LENLKDLFRQIMPAVDFCSLRVVDERSEELVVRQNILQPLTTVRNRGAMLTVIHGGGYGYAATSDLSRSGLLAALERAGHWAKLSAGRSVVDYSKIAQSSIRDSYA